ncbi:uncharacterized protein LOC135165150 [Diachasmimorpha longicaudata]|uniref:uncharacterized protein LOC135165150 n=1 Tax=Diachasmimorpha longicaudata TaxID=58733 RepID=UPI0030B8E738
MVDKLVKASTEIDKNDRVNEIRECILYSNNENEYLDVVDDVPCPEFQFPTLACYICNGYYGPCFEEPVCATCHAFLFPDCIGVAVAPIFSEKTDDEDSGNDEPTDLFYNGEHRLSQSHRLRSPQLCSPPLNNDPLPPEPPQRPALSYNCHNPPETPWNLTNQPFQWNCRGYCTSEPTNSGETSRPRNLVDRVDMLANHRHIEHEPINESGLVAHLPPEVLLAVFSHLDDVSLWSAANVCRRWYGLLLTHVPHQQWQQHVKLRWPLHKAIGHVENWYKVYDRLASSAPCRTCLAQMCLKSRPAGIQDTSWRRNRLRMELKSLRIDPPEGIEATPLDSMHCHWQATITGPIGSPYEGGLFYLYLQVPHSYPMCPPVVRFLTKILHPNVSRHGDVGIDSIHHNWSLALTISKVLISVQSLLTDPFCQVCMEPELGDMYTNDRERFEEIARSWTWKYAMHDVVPPS